MAQVEQAPTPKGPDAKDTDATGAESRGGDPQAVEAPRRVPGPGECGRATGCCRGSTNTGSASPT